jgi:hypothetical protein
LGWRAASLPAFVISGELPYASQQTIVKARWDGRVARPPWARLGKTQRKDFFFEKKEAKNFCLFWLQSLRLGSAPPACGARTLLNKRPALLGHG